MRLIFTILLIGLFKADAQIVINASSPYRPIGGPANLLLDDYPNAAAAYSLRKLDKDYTGSAIRVRKDTTGQPEQDIGFTASGNLDTAALKSFLNARSGFVTTWYDQSGNARNFVQTTQANQARIANLGVIDRENNKPFIRFDGSNDLMNHDAQFFPSTKVHDIFLIGNNRDNTGTQIIYEQSVNYNIVNGAYVLYSDASKTEIAQKITTPVNNNNVRSANRAYTTFQLGNFLINRDVNDSTLQGRFFANNSEISMSFVSTFNYNIFNLNISQNAAYLGARSGGSAPAKLNAYEFIIYTSNQSSNRTGIATNINTFYGIY